MTVCGHNDMMAAGMARLAEGIAIQADKRAVREKLNLHDVTVAEVEELDIFVRLLSESPKHAEFTGLIGFAMLVRWQFSQVQKAAASDPSISAAKAFEQGMKPLNQLLFDLDAHYFDQPAEAGVGAKMAALAALAEARAD